MRSSRLSRMPACSPAATRLQNSLSKWTGCLAKACDRLRPVSTSVRISLSRRDRAGLPEPFMAMSKACSSGTPDFIMVASWRVNSAMSLSVMRPPRAIFSFLILPTWMPWRRSIACTMASPLARISPRTTLPVLSLPSQVYSSSLGPVARIARLAVAMRSNVLYSLVVASTSSSEVTPCFTLRSPDWRRSSTPSRRAWSAMSIELPPVMMMRAISSVIGMTW